jgi:serine phosphatase RsbU (regulator of sigma subunit)
MLKPGEKACGDGFHSIVTNQHIRLFLGDGLGHGPEAAKAVNMTIEAFGTCTEMEPPEIIRFINSAVKKLEVWQVRLPYLT